MTRLMPRASLVLNALALLPICAALILDAQRITNAYGPATEARGILLSLYITILVMSLYLLVKPDNRMIVSLLSMQVIYKVTTPITVGTLANPIVISNLGIAAFHLCALVCIRATSKTPRRTRNHGGQAPGGVVTSNGVEGGT